MQISTHEKELITLLVLGATIGLGKLFSSTSRLTLRAILGQTIVGAGLSMSSGAALIMFNDLRPTALVGIAALIGCGGQSTLEFLLRRYLGRESSDPPTHGDGPS
ncbi:holin family 2 [Pandoraea sp. SD6-2]|uniref:holin family 2 n=1 Tax=Pandoraea sp. SD6-2 TaxID=1286093 RepID=UPI00032E77B3|nr:holin family 2 [Pandoraea sp. SD6-2]EON14941.1 holin family 2 [Pandoraea sp. SD6-2]